MKISPPMGLPSEVTIAGFPYSVTYYDNPCEVGPSVDNSYNGYINHANCTIRIWGAGRPIEAILATMFHEVLHGIVEKMSLEFKEEGEDETYHPNFAALANGISDTMIRNGWLNAALLKSRDAEASGLQERPGARKVIRTDSGAVVRNPLLDRPFLEGAGWHPPSATRD